MSEEDGNIELYYVPCTAGGSKHVMTGKGLGDVQLPDGTKTRWHLTQCMHCYMAIVSELNPFDPDYRKYGPGRYAIKNYNYNLSTGYEVGKLGSLSYSSSYYDSFFIGLYFSGINNN